MYLCKRAGALPALFTFKCESMKRIVKHELVEVIVPAGSTATRFQLPDLQNLRNVALWGVQIYYDKIVPFSVISGRPVIGKGDAQFSFLTLENYAGRQFLHQSPYLLFQTIENNMAQTQQDDCTEQEKDFKNFVGQRVNWPKSYIDTVQPIADKATDKVFLLSVYYTDLGEETAAEKATFATRR